MNILAVDTSTSVLAVSLNSEKKILAESIINNEKTHSQKLLPIIKSLLESVHFTVYDIDVFAVSVGPGSFTGLRIGVVTIKALSYVAKKPVIGIPTLDALSFNIHLCGVLICPIMDARNNQVFCAIYENKSAFTNERISDYLGINIENLVSLLLKYDKNVVFIGDGVLIYREYLKDKLGSKYIEAPEILLLQRASNIGQIALQKAKNNEFDNSIELVPFYLRKSQAERKYEES